MDELKLQICIITSWVTKHHKTIHFPQLEKNIFQLEKKYFLTRGGMDSLSLIQYELTPNTYMYYILRL